MAWLAYSLRDRSEDLFIRVNVPAGLFPYAGLFLGLRATFSIGISW